MSIKGLSPTLPELGKIKIGGHGAERKSKKGNTFMPPEKFDHFIVTTMDKDDSDNFIEDVALTESLALETCKDHGKPTKLGPCIFVFNSIEENLFTAFRYYTAGSCICRGNGEEAKRYDKEGNETDVECNYESCEFAAKGLCKPNGILSVLFPTAGTLGGVHKFRTTSWNSISSLVSQMQMFSVLTGGRLAGIHFNLVLNHKEAIVKGKKQTIYFVTLEFDGGIEQLQGAAGKMVALSPNSDAAKRLMLENDSILEDPEEFAPSVDIDDEGNVIKDGHVIDQVDEPEGKGAFAKPKDDDKKRLQYYKEVFQPVQEAYLNSIDNESPSGKSLLKEVDPMVHSSTELSLVGMKQMVDLMKIEAKKAEDRKVPKISEDYIADNLTPYIAAYEAIATDEDPTIEDLLKGKKLTDLTKDEALDLEFDIKKAHEGAETNAAATAHAKEIF